MLIPAALHKDRGRVRSLLPATETRAAGASDMVGSYGVVEKGSDCGHELKAEPSGLAYGFDAGAESKDELVLLRGLGTAGSCWSQEILSQVLRDSP